MRLRIVTSVRGLEFLAVHLGQPDQVNIFVVIYDCTIFHLLGRLE